jgi:predicted transglutaminase-like cysteine proteinase
MPTHDFTDIGDVLGFDLLRGTITAIDAAADTAMVSVGGRVVSALLFYHCANTSGLRTNGAIQGAAAGFRVGDSVIVMKRHDDLVIKVIGHPYGARKCSSDEGQYFIFYDDDGLKVAQAKYEEAITVQDTRTAAETYSADTSNPVMFHIKRFTHNVPASGVSSARDLYFVATSLYINPAPFLGWTNFATANPTFALVTNNANTKITMTSQVMSDIQAVNETVNSAHEYVPDPGGNDDWKILEGAESGDCEDIALTKAKALLDMGYPASAIHFEAGIYSDEHGATKGHGWLVVQTTAGDFALDVNYDTVIGNAGLTFDGAPFYARRRQIGSNWAFISGYGWMLASTNQTTPRTIWYILDPLLNIFYLLTPTSTIAAPFAKIADTADADVISTESINFSEDNNSVYVADGTNIKEYKLNENSLDLIGTTPYSVKGFVGRDGNIVEGENLTGRQDPNNLDDVTVSEVDGLYHISDIGAGRLGDFRCLYDCEVVSENGYYSYDYRYLEGTFSHTGNEFLVEWSDPDRPDDECCHMRSIWDDPDNPLSDDEIYKNKRPVSYSLMSKNSNDQSFYYFLELLNPLIYPRGYIRGVSDFDAYYYIYGDEITYYTEDPIPADYDAMRAAPWAHIEIDESAIFRGIQLMRDVDVGDNIRRMYKNGASCVSAIAAAVSCSESNILGLVYIPQTDRLNN